MISAARGPHNPYAPKVIAEQKAALDEEGGEEMARLQG